MSASGERDAGAAEAASSNRGGSGIDWPPENSQYTPLFIQPKAMTSPVIARKTTIQEA